MRKERIIVIVLALIIIGGLFYWFQLRPEQKLNECLDKVNTSYNEIWKRWDEDGDGKLPGYQADDLTKLAKEAKDRCVKIWK